MNPYCNLHFVNCKTNFVRIEFQKNCLLLFWSWNQNLSFDEIGEILNNAMAANFEKMLKYILIPESTTNNYDGILFVSMISLSNKLSFETRGSLLRNIPAQLNEQVGEKRMKNLFIKKSCRSKSF